MMVASFRRWPRRPSTDRTGDEVFLRNSEPVATANGVGTGSRVVTGNQFPSRKRRATAQQMVTRGGEKPVPAVGFGSRRNQARPVAEIGRASCRERGWSGWVWGFVMG